MTVKVIFDRRLCLLLFELSKSEGYISLHTLARKMNCTRRNVEYDIQRLNITFEELELAKVEAIPSKGVFLPYQNKQWFKELTEDFQERVSYVYSRDERLAYCLSLIIIGGHNYNIDSLANLLNISRSTVFSDIKRVREIVNDHGGTLTYDRFYKYYIRASGKDYISMLQTAANILFASVPNEILAYILDKDVVEMMARISLLRSNGNEVVNNINAAEKEVVMNEGIS